jgi:hypothetical protein
MIRIGGDELEEESLIELCAYPDMSVHVLFKDISKIKRKSYFIDTQGNLECIGVECIRIFNIEQLFEEVTKMKKEFDFFLFIDSITFAIDGIREEFSEEYEYHPQLLFNMLWSLIYENKATIIVSNHYRIKKGGGEGLIPRLGSQMEENGDVQSVDVLGGGKNMLRDP